MNSAPGDGKAAPNADKTDAAVRRACDKLGTRPIVLIGLMGAGKTAIGKRLATRLAIPFVDADQEIEKAAGKSISEIFSDHGEAFFRDGERRVIGRLLSEGTKVLATVPAGILFICNGALTSIFSVT